MFEDFFDDLFDWWAPETEEIRKKREELRKAREELRAAQRKALEEQAQEQKAIMPASGLMLSVPMDNEEAFRTAVENLAKTHQDYDVKGTSATFDNGYYRSLVVKKKA